MFSSRIRVLVLATLELENGPTKRRISLRAKSDVSLSTFAASSEMPLRMLNMNQTEYSHANPAVCRLGSCPWAQESRPEALHDVG